MTKKILPAAAALALLLILTSCQAAAPPPGPLGLGGQTGTICASAPPSTKYVIGEVIKGATQGSVKISDVTLSHPTGLKLLDSYVVEIPVTGAIGTSSYPPTSAAWATRIAAKGATLPQGKEVNIVLVLERTTSASGTSDGLTIAYRSDGRDYSKTGTTRYQLRKTCAG